LHIDIQNAVAAIDSDIKRKTELASALQGRISHAIKNDTPVENPSVIPELDYLSFENQFRGLRNDIIKRQEVFLPFFKGCSNVLDIGCGRGEFLEILKEHAIGGKGIDLDADMVNYCVSRQLDAEVGDAIVYLEGIENNSIDGLFIDQVVEHLQPKYLIRLLNLCYQKLKYDKYIVVETVNPLSLVAFFNFYIDMSHQKPVHPYTLKFLLESSQYREIDVKYFSEIPENAKLKRLPKPDSTDSNENQFLELSNYNIDMLNLLLWGPMDYAVIGKK